VKKRGDLGEWLDLSYPSDWVLIRTLAAVDVDLKQNGLIPELLVCP
jgi:hypothetical protein